MIKKLKFNITGKALLLILSMFVTSNSWAGLLHGQFFNGQPYSGEYSVTESIDADGVRVNPVAVKLKINGANHILLYKYVARDFPSIKESEMGFLSIIVNSGGMEGGVTYNYLIKNDEKLISIGIVQTALHLGKVEYIDIQKNPKLSNREVNEFIRKIIIFNPSALAEPSNAYIAAALLMLGQGKFLTSEDKLLLSPLRENKELSDDPVFLRAVRKIIDHGAGADESASTLNKKVIVSNKAHFFNSPNASDIGRSYLIRGDVVNLVKQSDDGKYWLSVYISSRGSATEKWLRCADLNYCP